MDEGKIPQKINNNEENQLNSIFSVFTNDYISSPENFAKWLDELYKNNSISPKNLDAFFKQVLVRTHAMLLSLNDKNEIKKLEDLMLDENFTYDKYLEYEKSFSGDKKLLDEVNEKVYEYFQSLLKSAKKILEYKDDKDYYLNHYGGNASAEYKTKLILIRNYKKL